MPKPKKQSHKKKLVTADDYRKDRDYWKRRALNQQRVIDTINHHKYRIESDRNASKNALEYFRKSLREVCPHDKWTTQRFNGEYYCERCYDFLTPKEINIIQKGQGGTFPVNK